MNTSTKIIERSPVVAVMGHVDHGKSTLLDYIRKTNIVDGEAGGITQHLSTYEVVVGSNEKRITFIDTPGHAAFDEMRHRGGSIADIGILMISAEDGVKTQTKHAIEVIKKNNCPFIVAINKIDKPNAQPEKVKTELLEEGIYVEGYGGDTPVCEISAKVGTGVDELLETLLLVAEMEEMKGDVSKLATGFVIEAHLDPKQGVSGTLIIKDGSLKKGQYVVVDDSITPTRMLRDFKGENIEEAYFSSPIQLVGFDKLPTIGSSFTTFESKKDAEQAVAEFEEIKQELQERNELLQVPSGVALVPIILKTDVSGTAEAIIRSIEAKSNDDVIFKIIKHDCGDINESDIKLASSDPQTVIIGFHINEDPKIKGLNEYESTTIQTFDIIYELDSFLDTLYEQRRIKKEVEVEQGNLKVLKTFSRQKNKHVIGGKVQSGSLTVGHDFFIVRNKEIVGKGIITGLQEGKIETNNVKEGSECGVMITTKDDVHENDRIQTYIKEIQ
jgi:translation initiation factor IF-2